MNEQTILNAVDEKPVAVGTNPALIADLRLLTFDECVVDGNVEAGCGVYLPAHRDTFTARPLTAGELSELTVLLGEEVAPTYAAHEMIRCSVVLLSEALTAGNRREYDSVVVFAPKAPRVPDNKPNIPLWAALRSDVFSDVATREDQLEGDELGLSRRHYAAELRAAAFGDKPSTFELVRLLHITGPGGIVERANGEVRIRVFDMLTVAVPADFAATELTPALDKQVEAISRATEGNFVPKNLLHVGMGAILEAVGSGNMQSNPFDKMTVMLAEGAGSLEFAEAWVPAEYNGGVPIMPIRVGDADDVRKYEEEKQAAAA